MKLARHLLLAIAAAATYAALCGLATHNFPRTEILVVVLALGCWFGVGHAIHESRRSMAQYRAQVWRDREGLR